LVFLFFPPGNFVAFRRSNPLFGRPSPSFPVHSPPREKPPWLIPPSSSPGLPPLRLLTTRSPIGVARDLDLHSLSPLLEKTRAFFFPPLCSNIHTVKSGRFSLFPRWDAGFCFSPFLFLSQTTLVVINAQTAQALSFSSAPE